MNARYITPLLRRCYSAKQAAAKDKSFGGQAGLDGNLSMTTGGSNYYYFKDGLGSVRNVIDSSQDVQNTYDYRAFGVNITATENVTSPYSLTGRSYETGGLGVYNYRNRYYFATLGIFTSRDAMWADIHRGWGYVGNLPTMYVDPWGLTGYGGVLTPIDPGKNLPEEVKPIYDDLQDRSDAWLKKNGDIGYFAIWSSNQCGDWSKGMMEDLHKSPPDNSKDDLVDPDDPGKENYDDPNSMELGPCVLRLIEGEGHSVLQLDCGETGCWVFDAYWDAPFGGCPALLPRSCDDYKNYKPI